MATKRQRKRYRLHQKIKETFRYNPFEHTVFVPIEFQMEDYSDKVQKALKQLQNLNYSLQTEIQ